MHLKMGGGFILHIFMVILGWSFACAQQTGALEATPHCVKEIQLSSMEIGHN
jgi:hypothetical protein